MKNFGKSLLQVSVLVFLSVSVALASTTTPAPAIFFTDLTSGPNSGGENGRGAYVTIYGNNFGTSPTVTWNGLSCINVIPVNGNSVNTWMWYQKLVVQMTSSCTAGTGKFVVTTNGQSSSDDTSHGDTGANFTVRTGAIKCASVGGTGNGTFSGGCSGDLTALVHNASPGDVIYGLNGLSYTTGDSGESRVALYINTSGAASQPKAVVAYPGATVTIGAKSLSWGGVGVSGASYWTIAGLTLIGGTSASTQYYAAGNIRYVGNDLTCPSTNATGSTACMNNNDGSYTWVYGNNLHDIGYSGSIKTYHAFYWGGDSSGISNFAWVGWNTISNVQGCRGFQFYSGYAGSVDEHDIHLHDNVIHDVRCDAVNFSTMNPDTGPVEAYNNVMWNVGKGPDPTDGGAVYDCFNISSFNNYTNAVQIYNNTCLNAGNSSTAVSSNSGSISNNSSVKFSLKNNIFLQLNGQPYLSSGSGCGTMSVSTNNNFYGNGGAPSCGASLTNSLSTNPTVVSTTTPDLHLLTGSPMIGAGTALFPTYDHDGLVRASPPSIGAYEFTAGILTLPAAPTGLTAVVH